MFHFAPSSSFLSSPAALSSSASSSSCHQSPTPLESRRLRVLGLDSDHTGISNVAAPDASLRVLPLSADQSDHTGCYKECALSHGLLILVPEVLEVLGGSVEDLEAARQRHVAEINKSPSGKRTRQGVLSPLAARATRAAWPQNGPSNPVENNNSAQHNNTSTLQDLQWRRW